MAQVTPAPVLPGVYSFSLPLPFALGAINVWFVQLQEGWMLVDCGMNTAASFQALDAARQALGIEWTDLRILLLTHFHPDHMGLAPRVLSLSGGELWMHGAEADLLAWICNDEVFPPWQRKTLADAGVPPGMIGSIVRAMDTVQSNFVPLAPHRRLSGGEGIESLAGPIELIATPGHSPGHICLHFPQQRALISGDHIIEAVTPNIGYTPDRDALGDFLQSLDRIAALDLDLVIPSHGAPFRGHREWVTRTREHHAERCDEIAAALPATPAELVSRLWPRELTAFHYRFALYEVLAHLVHMGRAWV